MSARQGELLPGQGTVTAASFRFIEIERDAEPATRPTYRIFARRPRTQLGRLQYDTSWRVYVFAPQYGTIWSEDCLRDVRAFLWRLKTGERP